MKMSARFGRVLGVLKVRTVITVLLLMAIPEVLGAPSVGDEVDRILAKDLGLEEPTAEEAGTDQLRKYWNWPFSIQYQAPQVQIRLVDSLVAPPGGWASMNHHKYTTKRDTNYYYDANEVPAEEPLEEPKYQEKSLGSRGIQHSSKMGNLDDRTRLEESKQLEDPPVIASRNIITAPSICGVGQRRDSRGICRTIIQM